MEEIKKRFKEEIEFIKEDILETAEIFDIDEENLSLRIRIKGPKDTKYEGNIYEVNFSCPKEYPFKPPKIIFKTPIDNPFLDEDAEVPIISTFLGKEYNPLVKFKDIISEIIFFMVTFGNNKIKKTFEKKTITSLMKKPIENSSTKINSNSGNADYLNNENLLENIKSKYMVDKLFYNLDEKIKLKIIKYNKKLQDKIDIKLNNYIFYSGKYIEYETNIEGKEYQGHNNDLLFQGEYLFGERHGKGKEYYDDELKFEGEYLRGKRNGKGKEYYSIGKLKFEGEYLNGERHGKGKEYYPNGNLFYEAEYVKSKRNGKGIVYDDNGKVVFNNLNRLFSDIEYKGVFKNKKIFDDKEYDLMKNKNSELKICKEYRKEYDDNGKLIFEGEYLNGERHGKGKEYNSDGKLKFEGEYLNGKRNGKGKEYDINDTLSNNQVQKIINDVENKGVLHISKVADEIFFDLENNDNGKLIFEGEYLNGERHGKGKEYYWTFEKLKFEGEYLNGKRHGKGKEYYYNGTLKFEGEYLYSHKLNGKFYIDGKIEYDGEYLFDKKWNGKGYDENGNLVYELKNGNGKVKEYYNDDTSKSIKLEFEGKYFNGKRCGRGKEYYCNSYNKLSFEGFYFNDKRIGNGKEFDYHGSIIFEGEYLKGKRSGYGKEYREGLEIFEGEYLKGKRMNGKGKEYKGFALIFEGEYINGEKHGQFYNVNI